MDIFVTRRGENNFQIECKGPRWSSYSSSSVKGLSKWKLSIESMGFITAVGWKGMYFWKGYFGNVYGTGVRKARINWSILIGTREGRVLESRFAPSEWELQLRPPLLWLLAMQSQLKILSWRMCLSVIEQWKMSDLGKSGKEMRVFFFVFAFFFRTYLLSPFLYFSPLCISCFCIELALF
jgi:hypothetical protein